MERTGYIAAAVGLTVLGLVLVWVWVTERNPVGHGEVLAAGGPQPEWVEAAPADSSPNDSSPTGTGRGIGARSGSSAPDRALGEVEESPLARDAELATHEPDLPTELGPAPRLWELDAESSYLFDHPIGDHRPARYGLRVDPDRILALEVGDVFAMPLPELGDVEATVAWVNEAENGDRGVGAIVDADDDEYAATLTFGDRSFYGQITTAGGSFLVEGIGGAAAVFRDDLDAVLVDPTRTDARIPPEAAL